MKETNPSGEWAGAYTVEALAADVGLPYRRLAHLAARTSDNGYTQFALRQQKKTRVISAPHDWLADIQRALVDTVFSKLPASKNVYSRRGRDVVQNAQQHLGSAFMMVMDVEDCFPSTSHRMVHAAFERVGFRRNVSGLLTRLVTLNGRLPQGPPSSPAVLSCVFLPLDEQLARLGSTHGAIYTRYMDDLCFSGSVPLDALRKPISRALGAFGYRTRANKTHVWGPDDAHTVTRIVVSSSLQPEPEYLRALTAALREYRQTHSPKARASLRGKVEWVRRLNPGLGESLERDFGLSPRHRPLAVPKDTVFAVGGDKECRSAVRIRRMGTSHYP